MLPKRHDLEIDLVAARLFVLADEFFKGGILLLGETLSPPHFRGGGGGIGDVRPHHGSRRNKPQRTTNNRTSGWLGHGRFLPVRRRRSLPTA